MVQTPTLLLFVLFPFSSLSTWPPATGLLQNDVQKAITRRHWINEALRLSQQAGWLATDRLPDASSEGDISRTDVARALADVFVHLDEREPDAPTLSKGKAIGTAYLYLGLENMHTEALVYVQAGISEFQ